MAARKHQDGVPVSISHQFQQFRLLELPPEIVDLTETSPLQRLSIKSVPPSPSDVLDPKPAYAVLCAPTATFQLRQVQTSNSLYVLETHNSQSSSPNMRAIASCTTTLELHPQSENAGFYLNRLLPAYDMRNGQAVVENHISKASLFADIPLSDRQCESAWADILAFEMSGSTYRPSPNALIQTWKSINAAATAEEIKVHASFLTYDLVRLIAEEGYPAPLVSALIRHLSTADSHSDRVGEWSCLDRQKVLSFVAAKLLEVNGARSDYLITDFLEAWKDNLPEIWRKDAELNALQEIYEFPSSTTIRIKHNTDSLVNAQTVPPKTVASRKWHEKFAKTRKG